MQGIQGKTIRRDIGTVMQQLQTGAVDRRVTLDDLERYARDLRVAHSDAVQEMNSRYESEIGLALASIATVGAYAFAVMESNRAHVAVLPHDWLDPTGRPNPTMLLQCLLTQIANHAIATLHLLEAGLENPARAMVRVLQEALWITLIVTGDKEKMKAYAAGSDPSRQKEIWRTHFSVRRLVQGLRDLKVRLGMDQTAAIDTTDFRADEYGFYSSSIHHSYASTVVLSFTRPFDKDDSDERGWALFGRAGKTNMLFTLTEQLVYFLRLFTLVFERLHRFDYRDQWDWRVARLGTQSCTELFGAILSQRQEDEEC